MHLMVSSPLAPAAPAMDYEAVRLVAVTQDVIVYGIGCGGGGLLLLGGLLWVVDRARTHGAAGVFADCDRERLPPCAWRGVPGVLGARMRMYERGELAEPTPYADSDLVRWVVKTLYRVFVGR